MLPTVDLGRLHRDLADVLLDEPDDAVAAGAVMQRIAALTGAVAAGFVVRAADGTFAVGQTLVAQALHGSDAEIEVAMRAAAAAANRTDRLDVRSVDGMADKLVLAAPLRLRAGGVGAFALLVPTIPQPSETVVAVLELTATAFAMRAGLVNGSLGGEVVRLALQAPPVDRSEALAKAFAQALGAREAVVVRIASGGAMAEPSIYPPRSLDPRSAGGGAVLSACRHLATVGGLQRWREGDAANDLEPPARFMSVPAVAGLALPEPGGSKLAVLLAFADEERLNGALRDLKTAHPWYGAVTAGPSSIKSGSTAPRFGRRRLAFLAAAVLLIAGLALPIDRTITAETELLAAERRFVTAPFDALVDAVDVRVGDPVVMGDVLAKLDGRPLVLQRAGLEAERREFERRREVALLDRRPGEAEILRLEGERVASELALIEQRLGELDIKSPIDGVILEGELDRAVGASLTRGDVLFELAPVDRLVAAVHVPILDAALFDPAAGGKLYLDGATGDPLPLRFDLVRPRAEIRDGVNGLIAEAPLANVGDDLRPGQRGEAVLAAGRASVVEVLFRRPYARLVRWWR